ncbi:exosortase Q [Variovorax sp. RHLX14]|uniref:exosortase Q n=1 Tax=Variovorax sp. RHLX14 TaxID=1259731 RepID=UPI003F489F97
MRFPALASPIGGLSLATLALRHPRIVDNGIRIDRVPACAWLGLQAAALWPTWRWMAARLRDGSDDPLGLLAIAALALLLWTVRRELRATPRLGWLLLASIGTTTASVLNGGAMVPPLVTGLIAVLAWSCGLLAFLPRRTAAFPVVGLAVLALPLLSSLQFYAGYPLRVVTAEASRWLLMPGFDVTREGSTLVVDGLQVIVDAPCSGVQMVWLGYFTACVVALWVRRVDRSFVARLPVVGLSVLAGNIVRNSVLVGFEATGQPLAPWAHDVWGLALLAFVCGSICWAMTYEKTQDATPGKARRGASSGGLLLQNRFIDRVAHKTLFAVAMMLSLIGGFAGASYSASSTAPSGGRFNEWPAAWDGSVLRPLALTDVEHRFAQQFPGAIARMTDGERMFVLRRVDAPTRMLHPAADCYRALGYRIDQARLERDAQARMWRCFSTVKNRTGKQGQTLRVCERIVDAAGIAFTDTSAWYWAAAGGRSQGPWQAVTRVERAAPS